MLCKKCVLPEYKPDIILDKNGVCNVCVESEKAKSQQQTPAFLESDLLKLLNKHRGKNQYDCLVMCSGGKDSTSSLYYMKKRFKMNVLAFTFDHGFENTEALENVKNAVSILGVDWLYMKSETMKDVFSRMIKSKTTAPLCHVCAIWYLRSTYDIAIRHRIPIIVAGWTKGQSTEGYECGQEYRSMSDATADFIARNLKTDKAYRDFPLSIKEVLRRAQRKYKITAVSPHWFLSYEPEKIMGILQAELQWKAPSLSYPKNSTNCLMNFPGVYLSMQQYGYTHYHIEMSKLIRKNELTREEALRLLEIQFDKNYVNSILATIGCSLEG
jgi:hypothetical protein